jgi:hypothetical protein
MIDPRPCDVCRRDVELATSVYSVVIRAETFEPRIEARLCPRCARAAFRRRRFGPVDDWALQAAGGLLEPLFGADLRITWLQGDHRLWAVLCRRKRRPRDSSEKVPDLSGRAEAPGERSRAARPDSAIDRAQSP